jgi:predicted permease
MSPSSTWVASAQLREMLWTLLGSVGLLLVIACVNVTNLLLARASARARESAVRTAIGARRADLVREWLVESLLLSGLAMIVGLAITVGLLQAVRVWGPTGIPRLAAVSVNGWVFAAACAIALVVGIATGLVPALQTPVADIVTALRHGQRGSVGDRHHDRLRRLFVAAEVALSVVLLVGAGLLVRSLTQVLAVDRGFQTDHRLVVNVAMPGGYPQPKAAQTSRDILDRIRAMPQVQSVAFVSSVPLGPGSTGLGFAAADKPDDGAAVPWATWRVITPDYFQTMGVPLLAGRTFAKDEPVKETRTVISKRVADLLGPGQNAVGRTIILWKGQGDQRGEVIGVVGNMRERGLENDPTMAVYFAANPDSGRTVMDLVIRTRTEPTSITPDLRAAIVAIDPKVPVSNVRSLDDMVATSVATRRFTMLLLAGFAALALILALAGVGGVLAYTIARRTPEIGLRLALGAEHHGLLRFVLLQGLRPVAIGLVIGLGATFWLSTLMSSLLFGIRPGDPTTYLVVSALLIATTIAACYVPARRVLSVDPSISLRTD